jgi:hypothetical protein
VVLHWRWELTKIFKTCTNPDHRLERRIIGHGNLIMVISPYMINGEQTAALIALNGLGGIRGQTGRSPVPPED